MTTGSPVTLADLEHARAERDAAEESWANYSGNNPNKGHSRRTAARIRVHELTKALKAQGDLPMTEHEQLCANLDKLAPNAKSRAVVTFEGRKYRCRYIAVEMSRSGKSVVHWDHTWEPAS
jgi:hypothetical protein